MTHICKQIKLKYKDVKRHFLVPSFLIGMVILQLCMFPIHVLAEENNEDGYTFYYNVHDGEAYIISIRGHGSLLEIPEYIGQYPVRSIGDPYDRYYDTDGLQCEDHDTEITKVILPGTLRHVCDGFLSIHKNVEELIISDGANFEVSQDIYRDYSKKSIKKIYVGDSMIGDIAPLFYGSALETIEVSSSNPVYCSKDGILYTKDMKTLVVCGTSYQADTVIVPEGVKTIKTGFECCTKINKIVLPESLSNMDPYYSFRQCTATLILKKGSSAHKICYLNKLNYQLANGEIEDDGEIDAPPQFSVKTSDTNSVTLTWSQVKNAEGYYLYLTQFPEIDSIENNLCDAQKLSANQTSYTWKNLKKDQNYTFQLVAYRTANWAQVTSKIVSVKVKTSKKEEANSNSIKAPKSPVIQTIKRVSKTKAKITWKKVSDAKGYEIYISSKKKSGYKKVATIKNGKTIKKTISKLKKGKKYYIKMRAYKTSNGKRVYSKYSKVKMISK